MLKQKLKFKTNIRIAFVVVLSCTVLAGATLYSSFAGADQFDEQIQVLQQQKDHNQQQANQLAAQASSYQDAVNKLQSQINSLEHSIAIKQEESANLQKQIEQEEKELARQKGVLGENIKTMYLEGQISTLEILASSKDLSEFVNKEQYRGAVQNKIKSTVDRIT